MKADESKNVVTSMHACIHAYPFNLTLGVFLGFASASQQHSAKTDLDMTGVLIGMGMLTNYVTAFDQARHRVGFATSNCGGHQGTTAGSHPIAQHLPMPYGRFRTCGTSCTAPRLRVYAVYYRAR
eukprot:TRINITY_DN11999_c0_g1_i13.p2 TRINITY_DN11999_c0_g1~~TRINITY_DN11999_c0_g1_i13.p2  ORF type:complete len:125 (+),score=12.66 TRINITY_DN11999_c0_g1_i13:722-1096(+)